MNVLGQIACTGNGGLMIAIHCVCEPHLEDTLVVFVINRGSSIPRAAPICPWSAMFEFVFTLT